AGAVGPEEGEDLASTDVERDAIDRLDAAERLDQVLHADHGGPPAPILNGLVWLSRSAAACGASSCRSSLSVRSRTSTSFSRRARACLSSTQARSQAPKAVGVGNEASATRPNTSSPSARRLHGRGPDSGGWFQVVKAEGEQEDAPVVAVSPVRSAWPRR